MNLISTYSRKICLYDCCRLLLGILIVKRVVKSGLEIYYLSSVLNFNSHLMIVFIYISSLSIRFLVLLRLNSLISYVKSSTFLRNSYNPEKVELPNGIKCKLYIF